MSDPIQIKKFILLSDAEVRSGLDRVRFAELLVRQLPKDHDGRNTWLLNYGGDKNIVREVKL